jgi:hypothetical protein
MPKAKAAARSLRTGATGPGNNIFSGSGSAGATSTSLTYAAPTTGTAASVTVTGLTVGQKLLVTIYTSCQNTNSGKACYMSFERDTVTSTATVSPAITPSDSQMAGDTATVTDTPYGQGASFFYTVTGAGTLKLNGMYRRINNTATFNSHSITVQVFG